MSFDFMFVAIIESKINPTPIHFIKSTDSPNISAEESVAVGSSAALMIALIETPIRGIPYEKKNGGITVPSKARANPHAYSPPK